MYVCMYTVANHWTTNHWIGLDRNPKIHFMLRGMQLKSDNFRYD